MRAEPFTPRRDVLTARVFREPPGSKVLALLAACDLPIGDLEPGHRVDFLACGSDADPRGVVGLEIHGDVALLRSLAVAEDVRGLGCGRALVAGAEREAGARGVRALYLLTTTAEAFFSALGYARAERASAPAAIRRTREFSALCPDDAAFMHKTLGE